MHTRTKAIVETLSIKEDELSVYKDNKINVSAIEKLETLRVPLTAIEQIKFYEMLDFNTENSKSQEEWIAWLLRKTKKSLNSFLMKNQTAKIVFKKADWCLYAEEYTKNIMQLHKACKPYFDEFATKNIDLVISLIDKQLVIKEQ